MWHGNDAYTNNQNENLAWIKCYNKQQNNVPRLAGIWTRGKGNEKPDPNASPAYSDYAQMVASWTRAVGCGFSHCTVNGAPFHYLVCRYWPAMKPN